MDISKFKVAEDKKEGTWFSYEGAEFLIAYAHRPTFYRVSARINRRYPEHKIKADPALKLRNGCEIMAECILLDWKGVKDGDKTIPFTTDNALKLLMEIEPFREWVAETSRSLTEFQQEADAEDAKALKSGTGVES